MMSAFRKTPTVIELRCDHDGCDARFDAGGSSMLQSRLMAHCRGWDLCAIEKDGRLRTLDLCPEHKVS